MKGQNVKKKLKIVLGLGITAVALAGSGVAVKTSFDVANNSNSVSGETNNQPEVETPEVTLPETNDDKTTPDNDIPKEENNNNNSNENGNDNNSTVTVVDPYQVVVNGVQGLINAKKMYANYTVENVLDFDFQDCEISAIVNNGKTDKYLKVNFPADNKNVSDEFADLQDYFVNYYDNYNDNSLQEISTSLTNLQAYDYDCGTSRYYVVDNAIMYDMEYVLNSMGGRVSNTYTAKIAVTNDVEGNKDIEVYKSQFECSTDELKDATFMTGELNNFVSGKASILSDYQNLNYAQITENGQIVYSLNALELEK